MKRRQWLGLAMVGVSLVLSTWALYGLIRTGSCGSGGNVSTCARARRGRAGRSSA